MVIGLLDAGFSPRIVARWARSRNALTPQLELLLHELEVNQPREWVINAKTHLQVLSLLVKQELRPAQIGRLVGCHRKTIYDIRKRYGLTTRRWRVSPEELEALRPAIVAESRANKKSNRDMALEFGLGVTTVQNVHLRAGIVLKFGRRARKDK